MLQGFELCQPKVDDIVGETIYTAAVWQTVYKAVAEHRQLPNVYKVKSAYTVGCGVNIDVDKVPAL